MARLRNILCLVSITILVGCGSHFVVEPSAEIPSSSLSASPSASHRATNATQLGVVRADEQGIFVEPAPGIRMHTDEWGAAELNLTAAAREVDMFVLELAPAMTHAEQQGELVVFTALDGTFLGVMAPVRAIDDTGHRADVRLTVNGQQIRIEPQADSDVRMPLRMSVSLGSALIASVQVREERGRPRYIIRRTPLGHAVYGDGLPTASARALVEREGWAQARAMEPGLANVASLKQQFDCHVLAAAAKDTWNLEAFRFDNPDWLAGALQHRCNWESA